MEKDITDKALKKLMENFIASYTNGILVQYGLTEEQALDFVSNTSGIPRKKLIELKRQIDNANREDVKRPFEDLLTLLT